MSVIISNCGNCKHSDKNGICSYGRGIAQCCDEWQAKIPEDNFETTTSMSEEELRDFINKNEISTSEIISLLKNTQKANTKLTARVSKLEDKVDKLEDIQSSHKDTIIKLGVVLEDRIRKLEQTQIGVNVYGKPIEQYANEDHFKVKLEKPKQNKVDIEDLFRSHIDNFDCDICRAHGITNCMRDKEYCIGYHKWVEKHKNDKWIVHRTLRKQNRETYLVDYFCKNDEVIYVNGIAQYFSYDKNKAYKFEDENVAIQVRDKLNIVRVGKRYLWVISKVEE